MNIFILEDNAERCAVMRDCLADRFWQYPLHFFNDASAMIAVLKSKLPDSLLIALDHDLELLDDAGRCIDSGSGRDVADFLAQQSPVCPIVIHTSNAPAALGMELVLQDSGWVTHRVSPYDDTRWISEAWFPAVRNAIVDSALSRPRVSSAK